MNMISLTIISCFSHHFSLVFYFRMYYLPEEWVIKSFNETKVSLTGVAQLAGVVSHTPKAGGSVLGLGTCLCCVFDAW